MASCRKRLAAAADFKAYASCRRPKGGTVWRLSEIWTVLRIFAFYVYVRFVLAIFILATRTSTRFFAFVAKNKDKIYNESMDLV